MKQMQQVKNVHAQVWEVLDFWSQHIYHATIVKQHGLNYIRFEKRNEKMHDIWKDSYLAAS